MSESLKRCSKCGLMLAATEFSKEKGKLRTNCRACAREVWLRWYSVPENRARHIRHNGGTSKAIVLRNRTYVAEYLKTRQCADCGIADIRVLEFDHVRGTKLSDVSNVITSGWSLAKIQAEIDKCDVVCSNCHRIRTGAHGAYFRHTTGA